MTFCICICLIWQPWPGRGPWFLLPRLLSPTKAHFSAPKVAFQKAQISLQLLHWIWEGLPQGPQECRQGLCQLDRWGQGGGQAAQIMPPSLGKFQLFPFSLTLSFLPSSFPPCFLLFFPPGPSCAWLLLQIASSSPRDVGVIPKSRGFTSGGCISQRSLEKRNQ